MTVTIARYTYEGQLWHAVTVDGYAVKAPTLDEKDAAEYARAVYHAEKRAKALTHWNGDTSTETVLDTK